MFATRMTLMANIETMCPCRHPDVPRSAEPRFNIIYIVYTYTYDII